MASIEQMFRRPCRNLRMNPVRGAGLAVDSCETKFGRIACWLRVDEYDGVLYDSDGHQIGYGIIRTKPIDPPPPQKPESNGEAEPSAPGPGDYMHCAIMLLTGEQPGPGCECRKRMEQMNEWGVEGCHRRRKQITGWLVEEAEKRGRKRTATLRTQARVLVEIVLWMAKRRG